MNDLQLAIELTEDAYSLGPYYTPREWKRITKWLLDQDCCVEVVIWVLMSKHMRWASDYSSDNKPDKMSLKKFQSYINGNWLPNGLKGIFKEATETNYAC